MLTTMLELSDKNLKAATIKMLQWAIMNTPKINEKTQSLSKEKQNLRKEVEDIKKNQMKILKLKYTATNKNLSV